MFKKSQTTVCDFLNYAIIIGMEPLLQKEEKKTSPQINVVPPMPSMSTFSPDLADELRKHQGTAMKKIMMENERKLHEQELIANDPKKNIRLITGGVGFVVVALCIALGVYLHLKKISAPVPVASNSIPASIIQSEDLEILNVTNKSSSDIAEALNAVISKSNIQTGMVGNVYITQGVSGAETRLPSATFLSRIGVHATDEFTRSLSQNYMIGIYSYNQPNLFIVLQGTQHDSMLAGMLQWEPFLFEDMAPLFGIDTSGSNTYLLNNPFMEILIENHDTRAVLDNDNKPVLFYSFLDENDVIITNNAKALTEAVRRLKN